MRKGDRVRFCGRVNDLGYIVQTVPNGLKVRWAGGVTQTFYGARLASIDPAPAIVGVFTWMHNYQMSRSILTRLSVKPASRVSKRSA